MKLFQKLIVAPATLGLLIPSAAFAEEIKLTDISNYSSSKEVKSISVFDPAEEIAITNSRVDGLESRFNDYEAGSFSTTTTLDGSAGLISDRQEGRWVYYSLNKESLFLIKEWITSLTDYYSNRKRCCE